MAVLGFPPYGQATNPPVGGDAVVNSLGMHMVLVPAGSFRMGSPFGEALRQEEEIPRRVTLTRAFRIAATEVTQRQWLALMPSNRSPQRGDDLPVTSVSWKAQEFCRGLSQREGITYRLPHRARVKYATCRAGSTDPPDGRAQLEAVAWYADNGEETTHPVGQKRPNAWGLHDMLGNVAEWTLDAYGPYPRPRPGPGRSRIWPAPRPRRPVHPRRPGGGKEGRRLGPRRDGRGVAAGRG